MMGLEGWARWRWWGQGQEERAQPGSGAGVRVGAESGAVHPEGQGQ